MTDFRNPGILLVPEARYKAITRRNGVLGIVSGAVVLLMGGGLVGFELIVPGVSVALLGLSMVAIGVLTNLIANRYPFVDGFRRAVTLSLVIPAALAVGGAVATWVVGSQNSTAAFGFIVVFLAFPVLMLANANRLVLRTAAAHIAPAA